MVDVRRDDHASAGNLIPDQLWRYLLPLGDVLHLFGDNALTRITHLREIAVGILQFAFRNPFRA